ncbi:hypothetical protein QE369_002994 [Agrobacterium larrymoorei]|uniref:Uncharacterized protein n=1 Tax=Agrobacterium larrymoorei TaxID=160699 RepID=A0AAJ2BDH2_9HYPH|nr:hypothetical protein [Agrobacterium larrymoorei]MDR6102797.1 hypothetical protein [Agrobacterium larrymoorei]
MAQRTGNTVEIDLDEDELANSASAPVVDEDRPAVIEDGEENIVDEDGDPLDALPKSAKKNADGSITLPLQYPIGITTRKDGKVRERWFEELTFHRLNGANQRAIAAASGEMMSVVAFSQSTRINQAVMNALFDKMDAADINNGGRVLNHFLSSGPKTGR